MTLFTLHHTRALDAPAIGAPLEMSAANGALIEALQSGHTDACLRPIVEIEPPPATEEERAAMAGLVGSVAASGARGER